MTATKFQQEQTSWILFNWAGFKVEVLEEFKDDDEEQQKYTVAYLRKYVQQTRKSKDADYRAFILDFTEKSRFLINARKLSEYRRVTLFLHAFSDEIGNKLCKRCNIDLDDPDTTDRVFPEPKREALFLSHPQGALFLRSAPSAIHLKYHGLEMPDGRLLRAHAVWNSIGMEADYDELISISALWHLAADGSTAFPNSCAISWMLGYGLHSCCTVLLSCLYRSCVREWCILQTDDGLFTKERLLFQILILLFLFSLNSLHVLNKFKILLLNEFFIILHLILSYPPPVPSSASFFGNNYSDADFGIMLGNQPNNFIDPRCGYHWGCNSPLYHIKLAITRCLHNIRSYTYRMLYHMLPRIQSLGWRSPGHGCIIPGGWAYVIDINKHKSTPFCRLLKVTV